MSYEGLYNALRECLPDLQDLDKPHSSHAGTSSPRHLLKSVNTPLHTLQLNRSFFNAAAYSLEDYIWSFMRPGAIATDPIPVPGPVLSEDLHHVAHAADTRSNFNLAVGDCVGSALSALLPGFTLQSDKGPWNATSDTWIYEKKDIACMTFQTHHACHDKIWQDIYDTICRKQFPWYVH